MADYLVDAYTHTFREAPIIQGGRNGTVPDGKIVNHGIDFISGYTRPDVGFRQIQCFDNQLAGPPYAFDLLGRFDPDPVFFCVLQVRWLCR